MLVENRVQWFSKRAANISILSLWSIELREVYSHHQETQVYMPSLFHKLLCEVCQAGLVVGLDPRDPRCRIACAFRKLSIYDGSWALPWTPLTLADLRVSLHTSFCEWVRTKRYGRTGPLTRKPQRRSKAIAKKNKDRNTTTETTLNLNWDEATN